MNIHADLSQRAIVDSHTLNWVESPMPGVRRKMLERNGEELARATSIVRYDPDSGFHAHTHSGGEEFLVLDGVFSDETGDYPAGMYVRNPAGSRHKPHTQVGTTILVKLQQFHVDDHACVRINTHETEWKLTSVQGIAEMSLHRYKSEHVRLEKWAAHTQLSIIAHVRGQEMFVLSGTITDEFGTYGEGMWVRNPPGTTHTLFSKTGCVLYVKTGHL